jgi:hypothetical protein
MSDRARTGLIGGVEKLVIEIVDYQSHWPETFREHEKAIAEALGEASLRIEHIGSTGLPATEGACPTRTGPLETGTDSGEMKAPGRSAVCERSRGI